MKTHFNITERRRQRQLAFAAGERDRRTRTARMLRDLAAEIERGAHHQGLLILAGKLLELRERARQPWNDPVERTVAC